MNARGRPGVKNRKLVAHIFNDTYRAEGENWKCCKGFNLKALPWYILPPRKVPVTEDQMFKY